MAFIEKLHPEMQERLTKLRIEDEKTDFKAKEYRKSIRGLEN
jgi:hypothetical protein